MFKSINIANYFILKGKEEGCPVTPMKVLKLTYIAHGWYLGLKSKPLITDRVEAWKYGPVIPEVYHSFKSYGKNEIDDPYLPTFESLNEFNNMSDDKDVKDFLDIIWEGYKQFDGGELSVLTHEPNTPWDITWNKKGGQLFHGAEIPTKLIKRYYENKLSKNDAW